MENKNKNSLISLILLLVLVGVIIFWFRPTQEAVGNLQTVLAAREASRDELQSELNKLNTASSELADAGEIQKNTVLTAIPEKYEQDKLITLITGIAEKNDINMGSISFSVPLNSTESVKRASVSVSMTGSEGDLLRFLKALESTPRKLVIKSVTVQFGETDGFERVNFSINMETYFQKGI